MNIPTEYIWFFLGIFTYRIVTGIFVYSHMMGFMQNINVQTLKLLGAITADLSYCRAVKYDSMEQGGIPQEQIEKYMEVDKKSFEIWKTMTIGHMIAFWPKPYRHVLKYTDWDGAMDQLTKIYKTGAKSQSTK